MINNFSNVTKTPVPMPVDGMFRVIQMQEFSNNGNIELRLEYSFVSIKPDKIIFTYNTSRDDEKYYVTEVLYCESETPITFINTAQRQEFLLILSGDNYFEDSMPHLVKLTSEDGSEGILYSLQKSIFDTK